MRPRLRIWSRQGPRMPHPPAPLSGATHFQVKHAFEARRFMSPLLLQVVIVVAFGALCFGCGYLPAFIVRRHRWRDEMIKRGGARYNWQTGKWEWGQPQKESKTWEV